MRHAHMYVRTKLVNELSFVAKGSTKSEGKEEKSRERNDICALTRLMRVYLDKVPARNRFKSESMPTMKGAKRRCAIVLAAIKFSYKTDVRTLTQINGEEDEKKKKKKKEDLYGWREGTSFLGTIALLKKWRARGYYGHEI